MKTEKPDFKTIQNYIRKQVRFALRKDEVNNYELGIFYEPKEGSTLPAYYGLDIQLLMREMLSSHSGSFTILFKGMLFNNGMEDCAILLQPDFVNQAKMPIWLNFSMEWNYGKKDYDLMLTPNFIEQIDLASASFSGVESEIATLYAISQAAKRWGYQALVDAGLDHMAIVRLGKVWVIPPPYKD